MRRSSSSSASHILRRFVQQAQSYNRCMFPNDSSVTNAKASHNIIEQILLCQNQIDNLRITSDSTSSQSKITSNKESNLSANKDLTVDIISNEYQYETSSLELNTIQQCCIISIISPYAFTIQLAKDLFECDEFFKNMNDYYNSIDDLQIPSKYIRQNLLCVTWDETASAWNRSQIMEYDRVEDTVNVFFVDLNSWEEHVPRSRLRFILTKYTSRPVRVLTCRLASIAPTNSNHWSEVASKTFQNVVQNCQCDVEPLYKGRDQTSYVNLFALHDEAYVCINDFLIHCQMAKPFDNISNEKDLNYMLDEYGHPMNAIMTLYWKAGEVIREKDKFARKVNDYHRSSTPIESHRIKQPSFIKLIVLNEVDQLIFVRYNNYMMLPWFTISSLLGGIGEDKIKKHANQYGFKPIIIDPLSHPLICSQLIKIMSSTLITSEISLYSIDCARKMFRLYSHGSADVYDLLDRVRFAEANDDIAFWDQSFERLSDSATSKLFTPHKM